VRRATPAIVPRGTIRSEWEGSGEGACKLLIVKEGYLRGIIVFCASCSAWGKGAVDGDCFAVDDGGSGPLSVSESSNLKVTTYGAKAKWDMIGVKQGIQLVDTQQKLAS
jgi:hypothetical protein